MPEAQSEAKAVEGGGRAAKAAAAALENLTGLQKAAILLVSLKAELAAQILGNLDLNAIESVSKEIAKLTEVSAAQRRAVLEEFYQMTLARQYVEQGGVDYARQLLEKSLPPEKAATILEAVQQAVTVTPFAFLQKAESENLLTFIQDEHPQTISLILAHLPSQKAAEVLAGLPAKKQVDVVKRIATMGNTNPEVVGEVEKGLQKRFASVVTQELEEAGGVENIAEILNLADRATERGILESLEEEDPDLVEHIRRLMFVFEDILLVNDKGVQKVLKEVSNEDLALALKTASVELKTKIQKNMSERAWALITEEMEYMGPVRVSDVEAAQQRIVDIVRRLEDAGEIVIQGRGGDEEVIV